jgi:uncharacterized short protein YbdD (DUF466 family)
MTHLRKGIGRVLRSSWQLLRAISRESAYEQYLQHHAAQHGESTPLSRREFYLREQQRKWSGISRCC